MKIKDTEERLEAKRSDHAHVCRLLEEKAREIAGLKAKIKHMEAVQAVKKRRDKVVYIVRSACALFVVAVFLYVAVSAGKNHHNRFASGLDVMRLVY